MRYSFKIGLLGCTLISCFFNITMAWAHAVQNVALPRFQRIMLKGAVSITISQAQNAQPQRLIFEKGLHYTLQKNTLFLSAKSRKHATLYLHPSWIQSIKLSGPVHLNADHFDNDLQHPLNINDDGTGTVKFDGHVSLRTLVKAGSGTLTIRWVHAHNLRVFSSRGTLNLAGTVDHLMVKLRQKAHFNGQYLRSNWVWIVTQGFSVAKVLPLAALNALSKDESVMTYFKVPTYQDTHVLGHGKILQVAQWR